MLKRAAVGVVIVVVCLLGVRSLQADQYFPVGQISRGWANNDWSFMTAWNLTTGDLQVSPDWYDGEYLWMFDESSYAQWTALFIYDDGTGQTRELRWAYCQSHIQ